VNLIDEEYRLLLENLVAFLGLFYDASQVSYAGIDGADRAEV